MIRSIRSTSPWRVAALIAFLLTAPLRLRADPAPAASSSPAAEQPAAAPSTDAAPLIDDR